MPVLSVAVRRGESPPSARTLYSNPDGVQEWQGWETVDLWRRDFRALAYLYKQDAARHDRLRALGASPTVFWFLILFVWWLLLEPLL